MKSTFRRISLNTLLFLALGLSPAPAGQILDQFVNLGRRQNGSIQVSGTTAGGDYYTIVGGGNDIWDRADECGFAYHELHGDFDIKVQVIEFEGTEDSANGCCPKAGIMARENLAEDSRRVLQTVGGRRNNNNHEFLWRTGNFAPQSGGEGRNGGIHSTTGGTPPYPNAWIRLTRQGPVFTGYYSLNNDGSWTQLQQVNSTGWNNGPMLPKLYVGLAASPHYATNANRTVTAVFTNYTETAPRFCLADADSQGCPNRIFLYFTRPVGPGAYDVTKYAYNGGFSLVSAVPGPTPNSVILNIEAAGAMTEGRTYTVTVTGDVRDSNGNALDSGCRSASFVHGKGFEARKIHVLRNVVLDGNEDFIDYWNAYRNGIPNPANGYAAAMSNTVFEDPVPSNGTCNNDASLNPPYWWEEANQQLYAARMIGVLQPPNSGNFAFAVANDDAQRCYLSQSINLDAKQQIIARACCIGQRNFADASGWSAPQAMKAGQLYALDSVYEEGCGGNYGAVAWNGDGVPLTSGKSPIQESYFVPSRFAYNTLFFNLGCVSIVTPPQPVTVPVGGTARFEITVDGTPPYEFQWFMNGAAIPGAAGRVLTLTATAAMNGAQISVTVKNPCCADPVSSPLVTLTVLLNPRITNVTSRGNCHVVCVAYNKPMQLDGNYVAIGSNQVDGTISPLTITGLAHGRSSSEVCFTVIPDLLPDTNTYIIGVVYAHAQDGLVIDPNPSSASFVHGAEYPGSRILFQQWNGLGNRWVYNFINASQGVPPTSVRRDFTAFEYPGIGEDNYGARLSGFFQAPASGAYRFWMASDDSGVTFVATDAEPVTKVEVCREPEWANYRAYTMARGGTDNDNRGSPPSNGSGPINLTAGQLVYLEGDYAEGNGGDHYALTYTINNTASPPDGTAGIPASNFRFTRVSPNGCVFTTLCDVFCNPGPTDQTVFENQTATFSVVADGTPAEAVCYYYQWSKNGTPIPGATAASYTTPPATAADNGAVFTVEVRNDFSSSKCSAVLHVWPNPTVLHCATLNNPDHVYVTWNKAVALNGSYTIDNGAIQVHSRAYGASQNIVVLSTDPIPPNTGHVLDITGVTDLAGNPMVPDPTRCNFGQGPEGQFCTDFSNGLPPGTIASGTTPPYVGAEGALHLTDPVNSQANYWTVPFDGQTFQSFKARWKNLIGGGGDPNNGGVGADGMSFNVGMNLGAGFLPEEGAGNGLSVTVDTWDNGGAEVGIEIRWNGQRVAFTRSGNGENTGSAKAPLRKDQFVDAAVEVTATGLATFVYDTFEATAQLLDYHGIPANQCVFAARTGGANDNHWIDEVCINDYVLAPVGVQLRGCPTTAVPECSRVSLTAVAFGSPHYYYQWFKNGVPIPGANNPSYTTPPLICPQDNGATFSVTVNNQFSRDSAECQIRLVCDQVAPTIVSVGSLNGTCIGVCFSECVEQASAETVANYVVTDTAGPHPVVSATRRADEKSVVVCVDPPVSGNFTVTARNIGECCPGRNVGASSAKGTVLGLEHTDIDTPRPAGTAFTCGEVIEVTVGGTDIWGTADESHFVYTRRCGDFDMQVQVTRLDPLNRWAKAGLDARINLSPGSPHIMSVFTPFGVCPPGQGDVGYDGIDAGLRTIQDGDTSAWGGWGPPVLSAGINWMRLVRRGDQFLAYHGTNDIDWVLHADTGTNLCGNVPDTLFVGLDTSSHNNGNATTAFYEHFTLSPQDDCPSPCGRLRIALPPAQLNRPGDVILTWPDSACCRLEGTEKLESDPKQTVWTPIPGTSPLTLPAPLRYQFFRTFRFP